jgi:hypothetical protein
MTKLGGGCLCGAIRYEIAGPLRPVVCCHCEQCRKSSGHFVAASACQPGDITFISDGSLSWYRSSRKAQRGFCATCGSSLFWRPEHERYVSIMAGTLDRPTGLQTACHIYVESASDYYAISDGLPQHATDYPDALIAELE